MRPENGAEKVYIVCGVSCVSVSEWNEHYIKDSNIEDIIIFDTTAQVYISWAEYKEFKEFNEDGIFREFKARAHLKRLKYKVWKPIQTITKKMSLKTKRKVQNSWVFNQPKNKKEEK